MKNSKGFTLVELIVTLAISMVLLVSVSSVLMSSTNIANRTEAKADSELIAESLLDEIRSIANTANYIETFDDSDESSDSIIIGNKLLEVNREGYPVFLEQEGSSEEFTVEKKIFDDKFYKDKTVKLSGTDVRENCVNLTIQVYLGDKMMYEITSMIQPAAKVSGGGGIVSNKDRRRITQAIVNSQNGWNGNSIINNDDMVWKFNFRKGDIIAFRNDNKVTYYIVKSDFKRTVGDFNFQKNYEKYCIKFTFDIVYLPGNLVDGRIPDFVKQGDIYGIDAKNIYIYAGNEGNNVIAPSDDWVKVNVRG